MELETLREFCLSLPGATEDIKWESHLCFNVGGKMFVITSPESVPVSASFKTSDEDFEKLTAKKGFSPAQYLAKHKWVYVDDVRRLSAKQWEKFARQSFDLIAEKLPLKVKKQLGIG